MQWILTALAWLSATSPWRDDNQIPLTQDSPTQEATVFALVYGFPLTAYVNLALSIANGSQGFVTNFFYHQTQLANATFRDINRPNVDTLYSEALVDLSSKDLVVTLPEMPSGRFYVFPFYDVFGNNFVNLGTVTNSSSGEYRVRYRASDPGYSPGDGTYAGYIYMPTAYGAFDLRIQVDNSTDAGNVAAGIQTQFTLKTIEREDPQIAPTLSKELLTSNIEGSDAERLLQLTARLAPYNPPEVQRDVAWVDSTLRLAGLIHGRYTQPNGVDLDSAAVSAKAAVKKARDNPANFHNLGNGWSHLASDRSGDFKSRYVVRALVTAQGYLQLKADQAVYPMYEVQSTFYSNQSYLLTFSGKPDVVGFWSLTVYGPDVFLVPNTLHQFALGDRSNISYSDGTLVYSSGESTEPDDGNFQILLQKNDVFPPSNWTSNWLPTPAGNQSFSFNLRWYGPTERLLDGSYSYPVVSLTDHLKK